MKTAPVTPALPEELLSTARRHWSWESLVPIAEVDGIWLCQAVPEFRTAADNGDCYLMAFYSNRDADWNAWCCTERVMSGDVDDVIRDIPEPVLTLFRNLLALL